MTGNGNYANLLKSILEKFVKAHQVKLFLASFSHLTPLCVATTPALSSILRLLKVHCLSNSIFMFRNVFTFRNAHFDLEMWNPCGVQSTWPLWWEVTALPLPPLPGHSSCTLLHTEPAEGALSFQFYIYVQKYVEFDSEMWMPCGAQSTCKCGYLQHTIYLIFL